MLVLPSIKSSKVTDHLENTENPFKVIKQSEQLLVFREKQRELQKLESVKKKIEAKYLIG